MLHNTVDKERQQYDKCQHDSHKHITHKIYIMNIFCDILHTDQCTGEFAHLHIRDYKFFSIQFFINGLYLVLCGTLF